MHAWLFGYAFCSLLYSAASVASASAVTSALSHRSVGVAVCSSAA